MDCNGNVTKDIISFVYIRFYYFFHKSILWHIFDFSKPKKEFLPTCKEDTGALNFSLSFQPYRS